LKTLLMGLIAVFLAVPAMATVELSSFNAIPGDGEVALHWRTASEQDNDHFEIVRNGEVVTQRPGTNSPTGSAYSWVDRWVINDSTYTYTLIAVDVSNTRDSLSTISATPHALSVHPAQGAFPESPSLSAFPNPFNPQTRIDYTLHKAGHISLCVFDLLGREVTVLKDGFAQAGNHHVIFDGNGLVSGIYFARLDAGKFSQTKKLMLLK
jgi:hypothetical protein